VLETSSQTDNRESLYVTECFTLPVLEVNNKFFLNDIDSLVLSYKLHEKERYKDYIYSIDIKADSLKNRDIIYISFINRSWLNISVANGLFIKGGIIFTCFGNNPDNLFSHTGKYEEFQRKELMYKHGDIKPLIMTAPCPIWIFYYQNGRLEFFASHSLPKER